jgi:NAD(P) transhydrogenase
VLVVEKGRSGVSVHTGAIPSKTLRETVLNLTGWRKRGFYRRACRVKKDIAAKDLMMRLHMTLDHEVMCWSTSLHATGSRRCAAQRALDPHRIEVITESGASGTCRAIASLAQRIHGAGLGDGRSSDGRVYPWRVCA